MESGLIPCLYCAVRGSMSAAEARGWCSIFLAYVACLHITLLYLWLLSFSFLCPHFSFLHLALLNVFFSFSVSSVSISLKFPCQSSTKNWQHHRGTHDGNTLCWLIGLFGSPSYKGKLTSDNKLGNLGRTPQRGNIMQIITFHEHIVWVFEVTINAKALKINLVCVGAPKSKNVWAFQSSMELLHYQPSAEWNYSTSLSLLTFNFKSGRIYDLRIRNSKLSCSWFFFCYYKHILSREQILFLL